jgi:hypothetical protein
MVLDGLENGCYPIQYKRSDVVYKETHYMACFHVNPSKLFTEAAMLNTMEANQRALTRRIVELLKL